LAEKEFQKRFLDAVDAAFASLGESARQSIYYHLESKFKVARNEIPLRVEDFEKGLEKIFGAGTRFLEVLIMRKLHENMGPDSGVIKWDEDREFRFVDYVRTAERTFLETKKKN
jgi:hypothetical protein